MPAVPEECRQLWNHARRSLLANLEDHPEGRLLTAGRRQFRSLWTRDFCYAARGLLALGEVDAVRAQLEALMRRRRARDGQIPRGLDSMPSPLRVLLAVLGFPRPLGPRLRPEFRGEHGTAPIDSNALFVLCCLRWARQTGDAGWLRRHARTLRGVLDYYQARRRDGLIWQPAFSDWQDSVRRTRPCFLTHLLLFCAEQGLDRALDGGLGRDGWLQRERIEGVFFDPDCGLYRSQAGQPHISLDGQLLALDLGFIEPQSARGQALYASLRSHPVWRGEAGGPGCATWPDYPRSAISWTTRLVGLRHYHDRLIWSWLWALSAKVAWLCGDAPACDRLLLALAERVLKDDGVAEVYAAEPPHEPFRTRFYRSEQPFAWGAGMCLDALMARCGANP